MTKRSPTLWIMLGLMAALLIYVTARAQQPKTSNGGAVVPNQAAVPPPKLNPEAIKALAAIFAEARAENDRHDAVVNGLVQRKADLYSGAGVPLSELNRPIEKIEADGTIVFQPRPSPSPK